MENNTPPQPSPTPVTPPVPNTPVNSTFSAPPASKSKLPIIIIVAVIILLIVLGLVYYFFSMKNAPVTNPTTQNTFQQSTPATPTPSISETSDEALISDTNDIDINMSALESNAASVDSGLAEPTPNL